MREDVDLVPTGQVETRTGGQEVEAGLCQFGAAFAGQHLFQYLDADGEAHPVTSSDVNAYIADAMGGPFTAKHFRTWGASVLAFEALAESDVSLKTMIAPVAEALGNESIIVPNISLADSITDGIWREVQMKD